MLRKRTNHILALVGIIVVLPLFDAARGQDNEHALPVEELSPVPVLVPLEFQVKRVGQVEVISLQYGSRIYLPVNQVFDFLRIKNEYNPAEGTLSGFFVTPDTPYVINTKQLTARVGKRDIALFSDDISIRSDSLYLSIDLFKLLFGLPVVYKPRALTATLNTDIALPVFLDRRIRQFEDEMASRPARLRPQSSLERPFTFINGGRLDYSIRQLLSGETVPSRSLFARATGTVLGGDVEARFTGNMSEGFDVTQTRARWDYVPPGGTIVRQYVLGDFVTSGLLSREVYGFEVTNHPPNPRFIYATEALSGRLKTDRGVFLFENNKLSAISHDSTTTYRMNAGLRYGVNFVDVTEFGYWGETYRSVYRIVVPPTLVPPGELDYNVIVGRERGDVGDPWHGELSSAWGVSSHVTAGLGMEYYDIQSLPTKVFPDFNLTARLTDHLIGEAVLAPNAFMRGNLDLTLPSLVSASLSFTDYRQVTLFNPRNAINDLSAQTILPFSLNGERFVFDLSGTQTILKITRERRAQVGFSAFIGILSPRVTTQYGWVYSYNEPKLTSTVFHETEPSLRVRLPANLFVSVAMPYDHLAGSFRDVRIDAALEPIPNLLMEFQYDKSFQMRNTIARLRVQYVFPFARVTLGTTSGGDGQFYDQTVSGSLGAVPDLGEFFFDYNGSRAGYGGILVVPFIDNNLNGVRDPGEPILTSALLRASTPGEAGFQLTAVPNVGWIVPRAIPYQDYIIELDQKGLDNPFSIPSFRVVETSAAPGTFTYVGIPVVTGGGVRGSVVQLKGPRLQVGVEYLKVTIREDTTSGVFPKMHRPPFEKTVETFSTGDYEIVGVPPGKYFVSIDPAQLASMGLRDGHALKDVTIESKPDGDVAEGINFVVIERKEK